MSRYPAHLRQLWEELEDSIAGEMSNEPELAHYDQPPPQVAEGKMNRSSTTMSITTAATAYDKWIDVNYQPDLDDDDEEKFETLKSFDKMEIDLRWNTNDPVVPPTKNDQASTSATATTMGCLIQEIQTDLETIPEYLTKHSSSFQQMLQQVQSTLPTTTTTTVDPTCNKAVLRKIAVFIYKMMIVQTYQLLWTAYLKSGLGELINSSSISSSREESQIFYSTTIPIWPKEIKRLVSSTNLKKENENEISHKFVRQQLNELHQRLKTYQHELDLETKRLYSYTSDLHKMIEIYIEEHLRSFRVKIEHQIELIHYDYHIRALKLEYLRHRPNRFQEQLMKDVCQSKYAQETTEQEYHYLKQQINYYTTTPHKSFECSPLGQETATALLNSIENADIRQQFFQRFKSVAEQARNDIVELNMQSATKQREEYRKTHEDILKKMWSARRQSKDKKETISSTMVQLILQRFKKISERIQCIYTFKLQSILP